MIKNIGKKAVVFGLCTSMILSLAACGKNGGGLFGGGKVNKVEVDPSVAKVGVYSFEELDLGIQNSDYIEYLASNTVGGKLYTIVSEYDYNSNTNYTTMYSVDILGGGNPTKIEFEAVDVDSKYKKALNEGQISGTNTGNEGAVGDAGEAAVEDGVLRVQVVDDTANQTEAASNESDIMLISEDDAATDDALVGDDFGLDDNFGLDDDYYYNDAYEYSYYQNLSIADTGVYGAYSYSASFTLDGEYTYENYTYLACWKLDGSLAWSVNLTDLFDTEYAYINTICKTASELISIGSTDNANFISVFDDNGNVKKKQTFDYGTSLSNIYNLTYIRNDKLVAFYYDENYNSKAAYFNSDSFALEQPFEMPAQLVATGWNCMTAGTDSDFIISNNTGVSKFNIGDTEITEVMNYINSDLDGYGLNSITVIDDTHFVAQYNRISDYSIVNALFTYVDPSTIPDKKIISMAVYSMGSDIKGKVVDFNKGNGEYRIIISDYSKYATDDNYLAGVTNLNNDILAGNIPDIICASADSIDYNSYAKKGLLYSFDELLANDEELKNYTYLNNVFDAYAIDGKHYIITPSFEVISMMASTKVVGNKTGWTISEFKDFVSSMPSGTNIMDYVTKENFLGYVMNFDGTEFIDVNTGKCEFDSDDFITLLEFCATLPEEISYEEDYYMDYQNNYRSGKTVLYNEYIYYMNSLNNDNYQYFDGNGTLVGFPSRTGNSAVITGSYYPFVIMNTGNEQGAWSFIRQYLTPEFQDSLQYQIPVLESSFDKWAAKGMEAEYWEDEDGNKYYYNNYYYIDDVEYEIPNMTASEVQKYKDYIKSINKRSYNNTAIMSIIEEEASACFSGQKSAKEVAAVIQSRVQLYINENQ